MTTELGSKASAMVTQTEQLVQEMRRAFDASFEAPAHVARAEHADRLGFLVVTVEGASGSRRLALRATDLAGLHQREEIVPLPSTLPGLEGLAGLESSLVAVYGLGPLLGCGERPAARDEGAGFPRYVASAAGTSQTTVPRRWLASVPGENEIAFALAFDSLEGYLETEAQFVREKPKRSGQTADNELVSHLLEVAGSELIAIVDIGATTTLIQRRARIATSDDTQRRS